MLLLNVWNLKFLVDWIGLDFQSYFIKLIFILSHVSLCSSVHLVLHLSNRKLLHLRHMLQLFKTMDVSVTLPP